MEGELVENNSVHLVGEVKAPAGDIGGRLEFTLTVKNGKGTDMWFDCVTTRNSTAHAKLEGFVNEGELLDVSGHLVKSTKTEQGRVGNTRIETKTTQILVYVDDVITEEQE